MPLRITSAAEIGSALGLGCNPRLMASTSLLIVILIFYLYFVGWFFAITIYPLENRISDNKVFVFTLISREIDQFVIGFATVAWILLSIVNVQKMRLVLLGYGIVVIYCTINLMIPGVEGQENSGIMAAISIPMIAAVLVSDKIIRLRRPAQGDPVLFDLRLYFLYLTLIFFVFGLMSLMATSLIDVGIFTPQLNTFRNYGHELFLLTSTIAPILVLFLSTSFAIPFLARQMQFLRSAVIKGETIDDENQPSRSSAQSIGEEIISRNLKLIVLSFAISISIIIILIPHSTLVNPEELTVGVDTEYYSDWQRELFHSDSVGELLNKVFVEQASGDRPLFLLVQHGFVTLSGISVNGEDPSSTGQSLPTIIEYFLIVLSAAIILTTYYLSREITHSEKSSLLSAILAAVSFQVLIGLYAGFYANMFALIFGYLTSIFVLRLLQRAEFHLSNFAAFVACFIALYLSHVYTWTIFTIVFTIVLIIVSLGYKRKSWMQAARPAKSAKVTQTQRIVFLIALVIVAGVVTDTGRSALTGIPNGVARHIAIAEETTDAALYLTRWENLQNTIFVFGGGVFANVILLSLAVYWLLRSQSQLMGDLYIIVFLAVGIVPLILGDWILQSRILFNIPFHIPAGIAISIIVSKPENWRLLLAITIYLFIIVEAMFLVFNFLPA